MALVPDPEQYASIKIVSDGTAHGTQVLCDGKPLPDVISVTWTVDAGGVAMATVVFDLSAADVSATVDQIRAEPHPNRMTFSDA